MMCNTPVVERTLAILDRRRWQRLAWLYPEWWTVALSAVAWLTILAFPHHAAHGHHAASWRDEMLRWTVMVVAMMFPLLLDPVGITAARSLWFRRHRAIFGFLAGYVGVWMIFGAAACGLISMMRTRQWHDTGLVAAAGFCLALAWQFTRWKLRGMRACHRTIPIAPRGWRANRDCVRYGSTVGVSCLMSCWALMLACALAGHAIAVMAGVSMICAAERYLRRPDQRVICGGLVMFALAYAAISFR